MSIKNPDVRLDRFRLLTIEGKDRIYQEIIDNCELQPATGCWAWKGRKDSAGYAIMYIQGKDRTASRFILAYVTRESMSLKADACHISECPIRWCCNPAHLFWGDHDDNCAEKESIQFRFGANTRKSKPRSLAINATRSLATFQGESEMIAL